MANLIQIKRSLNTSIPVSLANGELAYTANGDVLYIGSNGNVEAIAGKRYPGTLTANQALVANSTSGIDKVIVANLQPTYIYANGASGTAGQYLTSNSTGGIFWSAPSAGVAGSDTQVQFNDGGVLAGDAGLTFNKTTDTLTANAFSGNGALVTSVNAAAVGGNTAATLRAFSNTAAATAYSNAVSYADTAAGTAYSNAVSTAATDATNKAANAYSNAVSYADTAAGTAYSNAISVASTDATNKAANAYSNAVSYADTAAGIAYSNATSYADTAAGTAYSNATSYADTAAGTAYSNAVSVAATDATNKAANAYSNATSYADTAAGTAYSNAVSYAGTIAGTAYSNAVSTAATDATNKAANAYSNAMSDTLSRNGTYTGNNTLAGTTTTVSSNLVLSGLASSNVIPSANLTYHLGNTTNRWAQVHAGNGHFVTGTFDSDVQIAGDLTVTGNVTTTNVNDLIIGDPLIHLAANNETSDVVDIGFVGHYSDDGGSTKKHIGFFRDASDGGVFKIFTGSQDATLDAANSVVVNVNATGYTTAILEAYLRSSGLVSNSSVVNITANSSVSVALTANTLTLTTALVGTSGGTGKSTMTNNAILVGNSTNGYNELALGTSGYVLQSNGTALIYDTLDGGTF